MLRKEQLGDIMSDPKLSDDSLRDVGVSIHGQRCA